MRSENQRGGTGRAYTGPVGTPTALGPPRYIGGVTFLPAHDRYGADPGPNTVFLLHGILGNRGNWRSFARRLTQQLPGWCVVTLDHRHHGDSRGAAPPDTVNACADDLAALADHLGVRPRVTVGHSFGGKVVLAHADRHRDGLEQVWVLDSPPGAGDRGGEDHEVVTVLGALRAVPLPLLRREQIVTELTARGLSRPLAVWMTTNLAPVEGGYGFRFDIDGAERLIADYFRFDAWPILTRPRTLPRIDCVRAERSDRWDPASLARFADLPASVPTHLHLLENAGHWLHADNPDGLLRLFADRWTPAALRDT